MEQAFKPQTIPDILERYENSRDIALICRDEEISYQKLIADARHIARALMERGVKKGDRVVINMSRSADYIRTHLGVVLCGGIQVTLYRGWPDHQQSLVIEDTAPSMIVDDAKAKELLAAPLKDTAVPLPKLAGTDPSQIVFTSGSTGAPKGIVNCHQTIINCLYAGDGEEEEKLTSQYFAAHCSRVLIDQQLAFVILAAPLYMALLNGRTAVMATEEEMQTPDALAACIRRTGVDTLFGIYSLYSRYLNDPAFAAALKDIKLLAIGGERMKPAQRDRFLDATDAALYSGYGSSETFFTMDSHPRRGETQNHFEAVDGVDVHLLKEGSDNPVMDGEIGEICICGSGAIGCYWNDHALNAQKFVRHPRYGRMFRTGDLARREADGRFIILGRMDNMAKLRGQRIELGAIESEMEAFPGIQRAAAKIQGEGADAVLCGYYSGTVDVGSLRRALATKLPYYMVPALLRELPQLPLGANGKLDRLALPAIEGRTGQYVPAKTETEKLLTGIFAEALGTDTPIGMDDSFFELGGDSIRGLTVAARLLEYGYTLRLEWLFAAPTARMLAPMLEPLKEEAADETLWIPALTDAEWKRAESAAGRDNIEAIYPVMFHAREYMSRGSLWMIDALLRVDRNISGEKTKKRLEALVKSHVALRSLLVGTGTNRPLQVVLKEATLSFFETDLKDLSEGGELSQRQEDYLRNLCLLHIEKEFDASREVPFCLGIIHVSKESTVIYCRYSHILLDQRGLSLVLQELFSDAPVASDQAAYNRRIHGLYEKDATPAREYWEQMAGEQTGFMRLPAGNGQGGIVHDILTTGQEGLKQALAFCARRKVTMSALLHLAAGETLMELLELPEVSFASTTLGRDGSSSQLAGMFINHFPVRIHRGETLEAVQDQLIKGVLYGNLETEDLPQQLALSGMARAFKMNVENAGDIIGEDILTYLMQKYPELAAQESAASGAPSGIDGELTLMVYLDRQIRMDFSYSPAVVDRGFVKRFGAALLTRLRQMTEETVQ
ncbi:MAG: AMP-binding protein [Lachnospiraceae bacterium]|nr:AMP-binding protein [Lachnospiraceae bacterium]